MKERNWTEKTMKNEEVLEFFTAKGADKVQVDLFEKVQIC